MAPSPERQQYRALVADVAARAKAILPQAINGRLEGAVKLVLQGDVEPLDDGTIKVGSSDPTRYYRLVGHACTCTDFTTHQAPDGWCRHRIAAGIDKRVRELLPQSTPVETAPTGQPLPEAPASVNCYITIEGRQVQVTLRDTDEGRLLQRLQAVLQQYPMAPPATQRPSQGQGTDWCSKHNVALHLNHGKDGRTWMSHRTAEGQWCKGR